MRRLRNLIERIDGKGYGFYKDLKGVYHYPNFTLYIDRVQGDPFAAPSAVRVRVENTFAPDLYSSFSRRVGLEDYLLRCFGNRLDEFNRKQGSGKSGLFFVYRPGQKVMYRSAVKVCEEYVEVRFQAGFPAFGRRINGDGFKRMFFEVLPAVVSGVLFKNNHSYKELLERVQDNEDKDWIRSKLKEWGLVSFVADGSVLPRRSGVDDRPMVKNVVPFKSPSSLRFEVETPNGRKLVGMGVPRGVTLIVGGGYHGKTTLLEAIQNGIYNHVAGDGREWVITSDGCVKIRAEDGRRVEGVDISPFINHLPMGKSTTFFCSDDSSGSTSEAANILEALEMGADLLLIDEDTSATNFMIRDRRMQRLVSKDKEPITPFIDKVRQLYEDLGVSSIIVIGGSGDYLDVADTVIMLDNYEVKDVTEEARRVAEELPTGRVREGGGEFGRVAQRQPLAESFSARKGRKEVKIRSRGTKVIEFGEEKIDVSDVETIVEVGQTRAIGDMIYKLAKECFREGMTLREAVESVEALVKERGLEVLSPFGEISGEYAFPRKFEVAAAINRLRTLKVRQKE